jgi:hypothetical protein
MEFMSTMFEDVTPEEIRGRIAACHQNVQAMHEYWLGKRGDRIMPARADIEPVEIKKLLPMMMLVDVTADARRFVYRLVGTQEVMERGSDPTGKSVAEAFFGGSLEETLSCYDYVVRNRAPFCYRDPYAASDGQIQNDDIVYLPLSDDGTRANIVLVYTHCRSFQRRGRAGSLL